MGGAELTLQKDDYCTLSHPVPPVDRVRSGNRYEGVATLREGREEGHVWDTCGMKVWLLGRRGSNKTG